MDPALADYAIGFGADFVKMGIMGHERLIKHKRLMDIERSLG
jgi:enolase